MPFPRDAPNMIRGKLDAGSLPRGTPVKMWTGHGHGNVCDGCEQAIGRIQAAFRLRREREHWQLYRQLAGLRAPHVEGPAEDGPAACRNQAAGAIPARLIGTPDNRPQRAPARSANARRSIARAAALRPCFARCCCRCCALAAIRRSPALLTTWPFAWSCRGSASASNYHAGAFRRPGELARPGKSSAGTPGRPPEHS